MISIKRCKEFWRIFKMLRNQNDEQMSDEAKELMEIDMALNHIVPADRSLWPQSLRDKYPLK